MAIVYTLGSLSGKGAAYLYEGTRLASSQFATGAAEGYALKAAQLREQRLALAAPPAPAARQRKLATTS